MATMTSETAIPAHVPADRVKMFDVYNPAPGTRDMIEAAAVAAESLPKIFYTPLNGGHWIVAGYEEATRCARETETFSSFPYTVPTYPGEQQLIPLLINPPEHTAYRALFNKLFTPKAAVALKDHIRAAAVKLIDDLADRKTCDFVPGFSELLPVSVFLGLMGLPVERLSEYRDAVKTYLGSADIESKRRIAEWIVAQLGEAVSDRQAAPRDDLISAFVVSQVDGRPVTTDEAINMCMMIFTAGLDTVTVSLSYGMRYLAENPEFQAQVRADPDCIPDLVEELLRRFSSAQPGRTVAKDAEMDGVQLKQGDRMFIMLAAASLDPQVFEQPREVRLDRPKTPHLAFNVGPHRCVGMHLARVELQIAYEEWLKRIPQFRLDAAKQEKVNGGHVFSIGTLPLRWD